MFQLSNITLLTIFVTLAIASPVERRQKAAMAAAATPVIVSVSSTSSLPTEPTIVTLTQDSSTFNGPVITSTPVTRAVRASRPFGRRQNADEIITLTFTEDAGTDFFTETVEATTVIDSEPTPVTLSLVNGALPATLTLNGAAEPTETITVTFTEDAGTDILTGTVEATPVAGPETTVLAAGLAGAAFAVTQRPSAAAEPTETVTFTFTQDSSTFDGPIVTATTDATASLA